MVGKAVEVIPGHDLLFTWKGKYKLFELLEVRTEKQFAIKMGELAQNDQLDRDIILKIFQIGFNWKKDVKPITLEDTENIIEDFCQINGVGGSEVLEKMTDALCESSIYNKTLFKATKKMQEEAVKEIENRGPDKGEVGQTLTLMS